MLNIEFVEVGGLGDPRLTLTDEEISKRGERLKTLYRLIEKQPGLTESQYHGLFLNAYPVKPRTWREYLSDVLLKFDVVKVLDETIRVDEMVFYVGYHWHQIQNAREEKRVREMKAADQLKLPAFEP